MTPIPNGSGREAQLRILTYHRVADPASTPRLNPRLVSATPEEFEKQMRHLAMNYRVVSAPEVLEAVEFGRPLPERAVLITFDDAYLDFAEIAWPIMRSCGLTATLFVPTAFPEHPEREFWWDRLYRAFAFTERSELVHPEVDRLPLGSDDERDTSLRRAQARVKDLPHDDAMVFIDEACEQLGVNGAPVPTVLGWNELRRLDREGVTIGAHTRWHPLLTNVSAERVREEVAESQSDVDREIGHVLPVFSYPNGSHDDTVVDVMNEERFRLGFTQLAGMNDLRSVPSLRMHRTNITRRSTFPVFRVRLHPWADRLDRWRKRMVVSR
jgi:peptidoglycan/xylan/chitin deacetylase (PgdA/CDA1 family)